MKLSLISVMAFLLVASASLVDGQTLQTLCSFNGANGANPYAGLTLGNDGNFYGTTWLGGNTNLNNGYGFGTVFKVTTNGTLATLVSFANTNTDGRMPVAGLTLGNDNNFYGSTTASGISGSGTLFKVTSNGTLTKLAAFVDFNGFSPHAALTLAKDGNFYGTTKLGGYTNMNKNENV